MSDIPVLMSRRLLAASAVVTSCAAFSLLSGVIYVGCSSAARPSHLPAPSASNQPSSNAEPASPSSPSAPTTHAPQADQLPTQPAPVSLLATPISAQGPSVGRTLGMDDPDVLAAQALTSSNSPQVRYTALRRLEQVDRARAAEVAYALVDDPSSIVSVNALAVLVRQGDVRIGALDARSQRVAAALASQG